MDMTQRHINTLATEYKVYSVNMAKIDISKWGVLFGLHDATMHVRWSSGIDKLNIRRQLRN